MRTLALSLLALAGLTATWWWTTRADSRAGAHCGRTYALGEEVFVPAGTVTLGEEQRYPEEGPSATVRVDGFWIDRYEVTNAEFERFVAATGHVTTAERRPDPAAFPDIAPDALVPGSVVFIAPLELSRGGDPTQWWRYVPGAYWRAPTGPGSNILGREDHPVVHVSYADALAYARWRGRKLPTEPQWERAARAQSTLAELRADAALRDGQRWQANVWQGLFPLHDSGDDGYRGTAPVGCYAPNGFGVHDLIGNVWEWTQDSYTPRRGAASGSQGYDPRQPGVPVRVIKGGSHLCAANYCMRYRPSARQPQETDLGAAHLGFRTVRPQDTTEQAN